MKINLKIFQVIAIGISKNMTIENLLINYNLLGFF
jgi:hypothetical protein